MTTPFTPTIDYSRFIEVFGNAYKREFYFIALRFKRAIITYRANILDSTPIEPPDNSVIVIRGNCPPINFNNHHVMLFVTEDSTAPGIRIRDESIQTMLRSFIPKHQIIFSYYYYSTLFLVARSNPFPFMKKCQKNVSFRTLCAIVEARMQQRPLSLDVIANLRHFKRFSGKLERFNEWSLFAFDLCKNLVYETLYCFPSAQLGKELYHIMNRSNMQPEQLPPSDFYQCELKITDDEPLGFVFLVTGDYNLEYVSPMVVSKPPAQFKDSGGRVLCNHWMPLYRNQETWKSYGLYYYICGLYSKVKHLKNIIAWLQIQTSEKYKFMYLDLAHVMKILCGTESRWFLKP